MAIAAIAVGNLTTTALYVDHFQVNVYSDAAYTILVGSETCVAVKSSTGSWVQGSMISLSGLVSGNTYYMEAGPVSPGGVLNFTQYAFVAGSITIPACTYAGTFTSTVAGVNYDITPATIPTDIDHFEAIWTKDGSAPSNASIENFWTGPLLSNGFIHIFAGGVIGQTLHFFMRAVSTSGGYQNWYAVDNRTIVPGGAGTVSAVGVTYADGTTVQSLQPGQAGADVTSTKTAADTSAVNGINSGHIADTALSVGFVGKWWRTTSSAPFPSGGGELAYAPLFTTHDAQINYNIYGYTNWAGAIYAPGSPYASWIYARWTGYFICSTTGTYTFGVNSDDGANLFVNNMTLVSNLAATQGAAADLTYTQSGTIALVAGNTYEVILEYRNGVNNAGIQFLMTPPGGAVRLVNVGSAFKNAANLQYANGTLVQALQPAQAGSDVTAQNTDILLQNPNYAAAGAGWSMQSGWAIITGGYLGSTYNAQYTGMSTATITNNQKIPCGAGVVISASCFVEGTQFATGNPVIRINYYDSAGTSLAASNGGIAVANAGWNISRCVAAAPSGTAYAQIDFTVFGETAGNWSVAGFSASILANSIDEVPNGSTYGKTNLGHVDASGNVTLSLNTTNVATVPATTIANVIPNGYKLFINSGSRSYSITAV